MTAMELFGCAFTAFGPAFFMFFFTVAHDPVKIIVCMASAFFWMLSILISSLIWLPMKLSTSTTEVILPIGVILSVLIQELFRFLFYLLLKKAGESLEKIGQAGQQGPTIVHTKSTLAFVSGFGYGLIAGIFSLINVLADMSGPGSMGIHDDPQEFFIVSALLTLCFIFLHTFWGVIFFYALDNKKYISFVVVILSHLLVSGLTLLNDQKPPLYVGSIIPAFVVAIGMGIWSYITAGGTVASLKAFFTHRQSAMVVD